MATASTKTFRYWRSQILLMPTHKISSVHNTLIVHTSNADNENNVKPKIN